MLKNLKLVRLYNQHLATLIPAAVIALKSSSGSTFPDASLNIGGRLDIAKLTTAQSL
jgi:hypothetical protein